MSFDSRLLTGVSVLTAVIESGNFARAAEALGITTSGVSRAVTRLEGRVGARLLDRTTRSVAFTDEGRRFYDRVKPSLATIEEAAVTASCAANIVRGRLRVNMDPVVSRLMLAGRLGAFLDLHPEISLEFITREQIGDLVGDGVDVAVRFGEPAMSSLITRKLADLQLITVAARSYLELRGHPKSPTELVEHACIHLRNPLTGKPMIGIFTKAGKSSQSRLRVDSWSAMSGQCSPSASQALVLHRFSLFL